jgi:hypothetical protein
MARSYYSITFDHPADEIWSVIRDFGHYAWAGVEGETIIEDGKAGAEVGAVRRFVDKNNGRAVRQVLLSHSDIARSYSYGFRGAPTLPVENYEATIRVTAITAENRALVEWWATFDCAPEQSEAITKQLETGGFAKWLAALKAFMADAGEARTRM